MLTPALPGALVANPAPPALLQDVGQGVVIMHPVPGFTDFLPEPHNPGGGSVLGLHAKKPVEPDCSLGLTQAQGPHVPGRMSKLRPGSPALGVRLGGGQLGQALSSLLRLTLHSSGFTFRPEILRSTYSQSQHAR